MEQLTPILPPKKNEQKEQNKPLISLASKPSQGRLKEQVLSWFLYYTGKSWDLCSVLVTYRVPSRQMQLNRETWMDVHTEL